MIPIFGQINLLPFSWGFLSQTNLVRQDRYILVYIYILISRGICGAVGGVLIQEFFCLSEKGGGNYVNEVVNEGIRTISIY